MKRVKAACIAQTLIFSQKDDCGMNREQMLTANRMEIQRYFQAMERSGTRYQIVQQQEQEDGSIVLRVRKQYNDKADVAEYFV